MVDEFGKVRCNECKMDLCAYPSDYDDGGEETYCGHCQNERHVCPDPFAARELLEKLVKAHDQWVKDREESFRTIPSYDPHDEDQPCIDEEMGDWDEMDECYAYDAQNTWTDFAGEARKLLEMESK